MCHFDFVLYLASTTSTGQLFLRHLFSSQVLAPFLYNFLFLGIHLESDQWRFMGLEKNHILKGLISYPSILFNNRHPYVYICIRLPDLSKNRNLGF